MAIISLRFSPSAPAAQVGSLKLHPWPWHLLEAQQPRRKRIKIARPTWENTSDPAKEARALPSRRYCPSRCEGAQKTSADGLGSGSTWQEQREQPSAAVPAPTHFLPLPFVCQACLAKIFVLGSGPTPNPYTTLHSLVLCICCYLASSMAGILVERPALLPLSPLLWSQSFQRPCLLHVWNDSEPGGFHSPFHYTMLENKVCV